VKAGKGRPKLYATPACRVRVWSREHEPSPSEAKRLAVRTASAANELETTLLGILQKLRAKRPRWTADHHLIKRDL